MFDEYYLLISKHDEIDEALKKEKKLVKLSELSTEIDGLPDDWETVMKSSDVAVGFGADQVIIARDPSKVNSFIVALDLIGLGSNEDPVLVKKEAKKIKDELETRIKNINNDPLRSTIGSVREKVKLMKSLESELRKDLANITVKYYSRNEYYRTYEDARTD